MCGLICVKGSEGAYQGEHEHFLIYKINTHE